MTEYPPRVKRFLAEHPTLSFDEAFNLVEKMIQEKEK